MPELPEVETIVRELRPVMVDRIVREVEIRLPKMVNVSARVFRRAVVGARITAVQRRAKLAMISLSSGQTIIIHLKMSGQLIWQPMHGRMRVGGHPIPGGTIDLPNRYSHVIFRCVGGSLYFNDQRQFGYLKLVPTDQLERWLEEQGYGPEPLESAFTVEVFSGILQRHAKKRIKPTLMDQTVIAGVGNIYADEACYISRVHPSRRISSLNVTEVRALWRGVRGVMELSLRKRGTTADNYRTANGDKGGMMPFLKVYGRDGMPCRRCGTTIKKIVLAGRGTHFCPTCQR